MFFTINLWKENLTWIYLDKILLEIMFLVSDEDRTYSFFVKQGNILDSVSNVPPSQENVLCPVFEKWEHFMYDENS